MIRFAGIVPLTLLLGTSLMAQPPVAPVRPVVETHHGQKVTDPYRYMEDFKSAEVQAWVKGQAEYAAEQLGRIPGRDRLLARIAQLDAGAPFRVYGISRQPTGELFYFKQLATENVAKIVRRDVDGKEHLLIDPEKFPKQDPADHFSLSFFQVSPDGSKVLYGFAASGSEQTTLKVFDLKSGNDLPDTIDRLESDYVVPYWQPDSAGFVYSRRRELPAGAPPTEAYKFTQSFLHRLGEPIDRDKIAFAEGAAGSPSMAEMDFPAVIIPRGSSWAIGQVKHGDETDISLFATKLESLASPNVKWTKVCDRADQVTDFAVRGDDIYLVTASHAPRYKVVRVPLSRPNFAEATTIVPASESVVESVSVAKDALYVGTQKGVPQQVVRIPYGENAKPETIALPAGEPSGSVAVARSDLDGVYIATRSWTKAGRLYAYDPTSKKLADTKLSPVGEFDSPEGLVAKELMVASHDGVKVPLSIIHRKDLALDGTNPTLLSGYGAYGSTESMRFDPISLAWLERGGVLAIAHIRGGGAFGKEWHHAGRKQTKPNTWKDFIACGEYLISAGYTSKAKLAGQGGSAGGILIGRAMTERPDLFAAGRIAVGCTDMMRFESTMNGPPNIPEFGTLAKRDEFEALLAMSTLHHIDDGVKYPAILLTHGINDPRVEPWESAKAAARFQAATASGKPVLFRVDYHAGHGIGSTKRQRHEELADVWAFILWQCGQRDFQP